MLNDIEARPTISKNHIPEREFCKFIIYISFKKFVQGDKEKKNTIFHKKTRVGRTAQGTSAESAGSGGNFSSPTFKYRQKQDDFLQKQNVKLSAAFLKDLHTRLSASPYDSQTCKCDTKVP